MARYKAYDYGQLTMVAVDFERRIVPGTHGAVCLKSGWIWRPSMRAKALHDFWPARTVSRISAPSLTSELPGRLAADFAFHAKALSSSIWFEMSIKAYISVTS